MPNYCKNVLTVKGSNEDLNEFARYIRSDERILDFEEIIPEPAWKLSPTGSFNSQKLDFGDGVVMDWYEWRCTVWGTKWNLNKDYITIEPGDGEIFYWFETAWAPPVGIIEELVKVFTNLDIKCSFVEPYAQFYGQCGGHDGIYFEQVFKMDTVSHPDFFTYGCNNCDEIYVHDGRICPHCGYDEMAEEVPTFDNVGLTVRIVETIE